MSSDPRTELQPKWRVTGWGESESASIDLGPPIANPQVPSLTLYLEVEEDSEIELEGDDADLPAYTWSVGVGEEEAGFGDAVIESGHASGLEAAKSACWGAAVDYLHDDSYGDDEIAEAIGLEPSAADQQ
jgi:hypothetical protein